MTSEIALVTGASRGIGRSIALQLAKDGFTVVGTATSQKGADAITQYMQAGGFDNSLGLILNVADLASIENLITEVNERFGAPTVLINNAGITRDNLLLRMKNEEWDDIISTNLSAVFHMSKACLRGMMKARQGRIVNISSVVAATGNAGQANYAAAKAGMLGFTKSLAKEVGSRNITVNTVAPGFIDTDMTAELPEEQRKQLLSGIPLGRLGHVNEIAYTVSFLCSGGAAYITGETLHVNGGMFMA